MRNPDKIICGYNGRKIARIGELNDRKNILTDRK